MDKAAYICGPYRYKLVRSWDKEKPLVLWIMLNPSTADAEFDDPTIRRCIGFSRDWGAGGIMVGNLYAYRTAYPDELWSRAEEGVDIVGPENERHIGEMAQLAKGGGIILAWGGRAKPADALHMTMLIGVRHRIACLGETADGHPKHPLYLPYGTIPRWFDPKKLSETVARKKKA